MPDSSRKQIAIVLNGTSSRKKFLYQTILPAIQQIADVRVWETHSKDDAVALASRGVDEGMHAIFAAGGDGTLHQVVNGMVSGREQAAQLPALGLIPLGSANDFAKTLGVMRSTEYLVNLIRSFTPRPIDIGRITFSDSMQSTQYFINIADTGMGPYVADRVNRWGKKPFPSVVYYTAILKTFITYKPMEVNIETEHWSWSGKVRSLAIANGTCFGHGLCIAPDATVDDNLFSVFIGGDISVLEFVYYSNAIKKGKKVKHPQIQYRQARAVKIRAKENLLFEADGELCGKLPVQIDVVPARLSFLY